MASQPGVWTDAADAELIRLFDECGNRWMRISQDLSAKLGQEFSKGRCKSRHHLLRPEKAVTQRCWRPQSDDLLLHLREEKKWDWERIRVALKSRLNDDVTKDALVCRFAKIRDREDDPGLKRPTWSPAKDDFLLLLRDRNCDSWEAIQTMFRISYQAEFTQKLCENRYNCLKARAQAKENMAPQ